MKSGDLANLGFHPSWFAFNKDDRRKLIDQLPSCPGVYAIRCRTSFKRIIGESDILYFGCATNSKGLKKRIRQYFSPGPSQITNTGFSVWSENAETVSWPIMNRGLSLTPNI